MAAGRRSEAGSRNRAGGERAEKCGQKNEDLNLAVFLSHIFSPKPPSVVVLPAALHIRWQSPEIAAITC
jgi:hypothetical protein